MPAFAHVLEVMFLSWLVFGVVPGIARRYVEAGFDFPMDAEHS